MISSKKCIVLADTHIPFQDNSIIKKALLLISKYQPDTIILNGDILDAYSISSWQKNPKLINFKDELELTKEFLKTLRNKFKRCKIIYKLSNHEFRLTRYLYNHASEISNLDELSLPNLLHLKQYNINYVEHDAIINIGKLSILHGDEIKLSGVYPARNLQLLTKTNSIASHVHRESYYISRDINGNIIRNYTTGCLCQLSAEYAPYNQWTHGIAYIEFFNNNFDVKLISI